MVVEKSKNLDKVLRQRIESARESNNLLLLYDITLIVDAKCMLSQTELKNKKFEYTFITIRFRGKYLMA